MTEYLKKVFSVRPSSRPQEGCEHGFQDRRGFCVFCGATPEQVAAYFHTKAAH